MPRRKPTRRTAAIRRIAQSSGVPAEVVAAMVVVVLMVERVRRRGKWETRKDR